MDENSQLSPRRRRLVCKEGIFACIEIELPFALNYLFSSAGKVPSGLELVSLQKFFGQDTLDSIQVLMKFIFKVTRFEEEKSPTEKLGISKCSLCFPTPVRK